MWPMGTFNDPWILDSSVWSSIELHSSIFSSVRSGWRKSTIEQLGEDSQPGLSRMGAEDIYLVDLVVERCCNILNSKKIFLYVWRNEDDRGRHVRDMNGMAEDVSMDPRLMVQPFRSLEDVVYSTAEFLHGLHWAARRFKAIWHDLTISDP